MTRFLLLLLAVAIATPFAASQQPPAPQHTQAKEGDLTLADGDVASWNIEQAIEDHETVDPTFHPVPQQPEIKRHSADVLVQKDGKIILDWTPRQHARYLMEEIRQGLHIIQSAPKPSVGDAFALEQGRRLWPKLRDISCRDAPNTMYYDLDGFERYCPGP